MIDHMFAILSQTQQQQPSGAPLFIGMILFVGVFFYMTSRSQRREKATKAKMIENLAKNDRVMTIGGVIGTVVAVKEHEVTVKVDEATNTRMTFIKRSIQQVITSDDDLKKEA